MAKVVAAAPALVAAMAVVVAVAVMAAVAGVQVAMAADSGAVRQVVVAMSGCSQ